MPFQKGNKINVGKKFTKKHKFRLSESHKGQVSPRKGVKLSKKTKEKISKANKGKISPRKGVKLSEKTKEKIRLKALKQFKNGMSEKIKKKIRNSLKGRKLTKEHKRKISESNKGKIGGFKDKKHTLKTKQKMSKAQKGEKGSNWRGGKSFELYGFEWTDLLKHSIRIRDCFTCQMCEKRGWVVHHIDYIKKNCNPNNLITLCPKCHAKTNHNRNYWIEYFNNK